jgi:enoyl-CoA hydratase/carnithine racemase
MGYDGYQRIRITAADGICRATIDNPPISLLDVHLILELSRFGTEVAADEDIRVVIVDSADPDFFVAHADITLIQRLPTDDIVKRSLGRPPRNACRRSWTLVARPAR